MRPTAPVVIAGRYRLDSPIGTGGMGVVYRAYDLCDGREVAIKLLHPERACDTRAMKYFRRESAAAGRIVHSNVVTVLAAGETVAGDPYLVMQLVSGRPLRDLLREGTLPTVSRAVSMVSQVLGGLEAIHNAGFLHGDVKADNVLIDDADRVTLIDLGLMRSLTEPAESNDGFVSGTPDYMAPEIVRCEGSRVESDLYAVGTLLYELLTGGTPFAGGTPSQILYRHLVDAVVPPGARCPERIFPRAIEDVVLWSLEKDPAHRPHSARAFACRLREALPEPEATRMEGSWPVPVVFSTTATTLCWKRGTRAAR